MSDDQEAPAPPTAEQIMMSLPPVDAQSVSDYVGKYVKLRDKIKAIEDLNKQRLAPFKTMLEALNSLLLNFLNTAGVDSVQVKDQGTFYKTAKTSASIQDGDAFRRHVIGAADYDLLDWKANANAVKAFMDANNGDLPPGIKLNVLYVAGVRKANG